MLDVMSFGGGVQSTAIMTLAGEGMIPMPSRWVLKNKVKKNKVKKNKVKKNKVKKNKVKGRHFRCVCRGCGGKRKVPWAEFTARRLTRQEPTCHVCGDGMAFVGRKDAK